MKIGIDVGNYTTCSSEGVIFESKCSSISRQLYGEEFVLENEKFYLEEGVFDSEYRKVKKQNYLKLLYAALSKSTNERNIELALGLPLSQYKKDKENLEELIMKNSILHGDKTFIIRDIQVFPEGVVTTQKDYEGILVDIGGRTTDVCFIEQVEGRRLIRNPKSIPSGMINLENDFINIINSRFGANFNQNDFKRVIRSGVNIYGEKQDITFAINIFKEYLEDLLKDINSEYDLVYNKIIFTGGGSSTLKKSILKRIPNATISENAIMDNANSYRKMLGE